MKRKILYPILLLTVSICFSLILLEIIIRLFFPLHGKILQVNKYMESERGKFARYDPVLGWDGLEGVEDDFEWVDCRHHVRHNKYGYRGATHGPERTARKRLLFLGDSFTWGFGVEEGELFTSLMESESGGEIEVVNMGVSGYSTDQELLLWERKGRLWKPDEVFVMVVTTHDHIDSLKEVNYGRGKPHFLIGADGSLHLSNVPVPVPVKGDDWDIGPVKINTAKERGEWLHRLTSHSAFVSLLVSAAARNDSFRAYLSDRGLLTGKRHTYTGSSETHLRYLSEITEDTSDEWETVFKILLNFRDSALESGARFTVVMVSTELQVYPDIWKRFSEHHSISGDDRYSPDAPNNIIKRWAAKNNINVIDLLPLFREAGEGNPYLFFPYNGHWTSAGPELVAGRLLGDLEDR